MTKGTKRTELFDINSSLRLDGFVNGIGTDEIAILLDGDLGGNGSRAVEQNRNLLAFKCFNDYAVLRVRLDKLRFDGSFDGLFTCR